MRVGLAGFSIESSTFTPLITQAENFTVLRGDQLLRAFPQLAAYADVQAAPLIYARSLPGGAVERGFYESFKSELLEKLQAAAPLDGLLLHMHGAAYAVGLQDLEGDLLSLVRETVGPACFISASFDLHGNLSQRVFNALDYLSAFRTAPHIDGQETLERSVSALIRCLREGIRPCKAYMRLPVLLPGEQTSTNWEPAAGLYAFLRDLVRPDQVMDISLLIGYLWADEPRSAAGIAAYGMDAQAVKEAVLQLARRFWSVRQDFHFGMTALPADDCIRAALPDQERPVLISDSGDNPTAGGAGDSPYMLERLLDLGVNDAVFASIADPRAVAACFEAGLEASVQVSLGGKLDPVNARPLPVRGAVRFLAECPWPPHNPPANSRANRIAVLDIGGINVIVTELRTPFHRLADFRALGIEPERQQIIVVKIGYLEPELAKLAKRSLLALSPGGVSQDLLNLPFKSLQRPIYPLDPDMDWTPEL